MAKIQRNLATLHTSIVKRICLLRSEKVIIDVFLSELYDVETRTLKQAVRRNIARFPPDFMFILNQKEIDELIAAGVLPDKKSLGGALPFAFTESGVAMLSSVLKSQSAIEMNISIVRTFVALRRVATEHKEIMGIIDALKLKYDKQFDELYSALNRLLSQPVVERVRVGFRRNSELR